MNRVVLPSRSRDGRGLENEIGMTAYRVAGQVHFRPQFIMCT